MKRKTKLTLGGLTLLLGAVVLSGCTASFCSVTDKAHILYAFDYGITRYQADGDTEAVMYITDTTSETGKKAVTLTNVKYKAYSTTLSDEDLRKEIYTHCSTYKSIDESATKNGIALPGVKFLTTLDSVVLGHAVEAAYADSAVKTQWSLTTIDKASEELILEKVLRDYTDPTLGKDKKGIARSHHHKIRKLIHYDNYLRHLFRSSFSTLSDICNTLVKAFNIADPALSKYLISLIHLGNGPV